MDDFRLLIAKPTPTHQACDRWWRYETPGLSPRLARRFSNSAAAGSTTRRVERALTAKDRRPVEGVEQKTTQQAPRLGDRRPRPGRLVDRSASWLPAGSPRAGARSSRVGRPGPTNGKKPPQPAPPRPSTPLPTTQKQRRAAGSFCNVQRSRLDYRPAEALKQAVTRFKPNRP